MLLGVILLGRDRPGFLGRRLGRCQLGQQQLQRLQAAGRPQRLGFSLLPSLALLAGQGLGTGQVVT